MIATLLRKASSIELTSSIPPKLILALENSSKEFSLPSNKLVSELIEDIRKEYKAKLQISLSVNSEPVPETSSLGSITSHEFTITIGPNQIHVLPGLALFIRGHEKYYSKCHELGVPFNEARSIARFLESLESQLPEEFSSAEFEKALQKSKSILNTFGSEEVEILKNQLYRFQRILEPLEQELENIKRKSDKYADNVLKLGLSVLMTQWIGIGYGTFVLYGWDVMEPFSYMVGSTWAVAGFSFFMMQRSEFEPDSFREILYQKKFQKLIKKEKFSLQRIELLKKNIEMIQKEINDLE